MSWQLQEDNVHYTDGRRAYPRVSEILSHEGISDFSMINPEILKAACDYGDAFHYTAQLHLQNRLDLTTLDDQLVPDLNALIKFMNDFKVEPEHIEEVFVSHSYRYGCRIDLVALVRGVRTVVDWKTSTTFHRAAALQLAANMHAYNENRKPKERAKKRMVVLFNQDGTYTLPKKDFFKAGDLSAFLSATTLYHWKKGA